MNLLETKVDSLGIAVQKSDGGGNGFSGIFWVAFQGLFKKKPYKAPSNYGNEFCGEVHECAG